MTTYNQVIEALELLNLYESATYIKELYRSNNLKEEQLEFINSLLSNQVIMRKEHLKLYNVKRAGFPSIKTIEEYDFSFQPSIQEDKIKSILYSNFYEKAENIIFLGNPGTGKTHLSISIGMNMIEKKHSVYFIKFGKLINVLNQAYLDGNLQNRLNLYCRPKLLIIDEMGFNKISQLEAKLFFQLIDQRYEVKSTIITTNISFDKWHTILGEDEMLTRATLDRLLHHSYLININGPSYRIKDKLNKKSGDT